VKIYVREKQENLSTKWANATYIATLTYLVYHVSSWSIDYHSAWNWPPCWLCSGWSSSWYVNGSLTLGYCLFYFDYDMLVMNLNYKIWHCILIKFENFEFSFYQSLNYNFVIIVIFTHYECLLLFISLII